MRGAFLKFQDSRSLYGDDSNFHNYDTVGIFLKAVLCFSKVLL